MTKIQSASNKVLELKLIFFKKPKIVLLLLLRIFFINTTRNWIPVS